LARENLIESRGSHEQRHVYTTAAHVRGATTGHQHYIATYPHDIKRQFVEKYHIFQSVKKNKQLSQAIVLQPWPETAEAE
jgi:hypothetical protein